MSSFLSFKNLAFRVHLKPAPRTQSESKAVFQALQDFGPIHTFKIVHREPVSPRDVHEDGTLQSTTADLVFANNTKAVDELRNRKSSRRFTVTANANIPSAEVKDPYNVRGLKNRKAELEARRFQCQILPLKDEDLVSELDILHTNEYRGAFAVDRNSSFGEILARTDCPSGLIHGLLPRLKDEHRRKAFDLGSPEDTKNASERNTEVWDEGQNIQGSRRVSFIHLDLNRSENGQQESSFSGKSNGPFADKCQEEQTTYHDEFAELRDFSLMRTYREATQDDRNRMKRPSTDFRPFS